MSFNLCRDIGAAEETVFMLFNYENDIAYSDLLQRLAATQGSGIETAVMDMYRAEFNRLEEIKNSVCSGLNTAHPIMLKYFKNVSEYKEEPFGLFDIVFEGLYDFERVHDFDGTFASLGNIWREYCINGYEFKSDGVSWTIAPAEPSDDPNYLLIQTNNLPYSKDVCLKIYLFLSDFDNELNKIKEFIRPYAEKLKKELENDTFRRDCIIARWESALCNMDFDAYIRSITGNAPGYDSEAPFFIRFFSMRPNRLLFSTPYGGCPNRSNYLAIGIGILPQFKFYGFSLEPEKILETLKLMGSRTKFEIMQSVREKPKYCMELANELGVNRGHMSRNLTTLRYAGLLRTDREGRGCYSINREYLDVFFNCVREMFLGKDEITKRGD